jgi:hypothetical protein
LIGHRIAINKKWPHGLCGHYINLSEETKD